MLKKKRVYQKPRERVFSSFKKETVFLPSFETVPKDPVTTVRKLNIARVKIAGKNKTVLICR